MKKLISLMLALLLCLSLAACGSTAETKKEEPDSAAPAQEAAPAEAVPAAEIAEEDKPSVDAVPVTINVTISDTGALRVINEPVTVMDNDGDGKVTPAEVLVAAHDEFYTGGALAGFISEQTDFGMSIIMLWGVNNGGSYGYYVNDAYVLPDYELVEGDYICAYSYADLTGWSDCYSFFNTRNLEVNAGEEFTLQLSKLVYDENWVLQTENAAGAIITVNGEMGHGETDADGNVTLKLNAGNYVISAMGGEESILVPPVCIVTVK